MENVLHQAEQLAEAILESEEFIKMRLSEQAAMRDASAAGLIAEYSERRTQVENLLASNDVDHVFRRIFTGQISHCLGIPFYQG